jgi:predicted lipoprotein with Yx(FWY)xxD motif
MVQPALVAPFFREHLTPLTLRSTRWATLAAIGAAASGCALSAGSPPAPAKAMNGLLVGSVNQMTLYTFDRDPAGGGKSVCNGPCAQNWPPLAADGSAHSMGDWSVLSRDDGAKQWAYKGKPLYFWVKDKQPGDTTGDGFNNVWRLARP